MTKEKKVGQILLEIKAFTYLNKMPHKSGLVKICPHPLQRAGHFEKQNDHHMMNSW
jgi:hypothetical protein